MVWHFDFYRERIAAISDTGEQITYGQLYRFGDDICSAMPSRQLVFCLCSNTLGSLAGYTAFLQNRIVPLLLDSRMDRSLLADLVASYRPDYFWMPQSIVGEFQEKLAVEISHVISAYGYCLLKTEGPDHTATHSNTPFHEQLGLLLTTSGSTGSPNLVRQSYENIIANATSIIKSLEINAEERSITTLPMHYTYGLSIINSHLLAGATLLLTTKTIPQKEFWSFFRQQAATSFGGVPYTYEMLKRLHFFLMDLPSLKTMTQSGSRLSPELHREFAEYAHTSGRRFIAMYGQTEATARMSYLPHEKSMNKCGSIGIAIPGGEFSLIDLDGNVITESNATGELAYTGPNVTLGYAESREDLCKGNENGAILLTGDFARRDEDGYYYVVGRKKRFIKMFGSRVNLDDAERLIQSAFPENDCACAGRDDNMSIFVTNAIQIPSIRRFISEKTGINQTAFSVIPIAVIPRNEAGKTLYPELAKSIDSACSVRKMP
jgi:long-chain acyl-CoA synthetase